VSLSAVPAFNNRYSERIELLNDVTRITAEKGSSSECDTAISSRQRDLHHCDLRRRWTKMSTAHGRMLERFSGLFMAVKRGVIGNIIVMARALGWLLIVLAILGLPQMRFITGSLVSLFRTLSSLALVLAGIAWLIVVEFFVQFFDQYLSRN
jgi:hypothetical protein